MNGYKLRQLRKSANIDEYEDFIIGLIDSEPKINVSYLLLMSSSVASLATIHKALKACENKGYVKSVVSPSDRRNKNLSLTVKSRNYLNSMKSLFQGA